MSGAETQEKDLDQGESLLAKIALEAELADYSPVKGCMVIRPYGYAIWEQIQSSLDKMIKETGHQNAYFPLFIPESFLQKEAKHVEGFAPECAVVSYAGGKELEEKLVVRPTSETIINYMFSKWIQSYRDLPVLINQWANIVRWEMRTRLFLRTTEFLWQEGHTAHATREEAEVETKKMLGVYKTLSEEYLAIPIIDGIKTETQRFAGAVTTYCIEGLMKDGKSLQMGTSHYLGQNFARAFDTKFQDQNGQLQHVHQTSWGVSTRLIGAIIMTHSDEKGLRLPPKIAPIQIIVVPIYKEQAEKEMVLKKCKELEETLKNDFRIKTDDRDQYSPGWKFNHWEIKGVPIRINLGPKDISSNVVEIVRRDTKEKLKNVPQQDLRQYLLKLSTEIQENLFRQANDFLIKNTFTVKNEKEFAEKINSGGYLICFWCEKTQCEEKLKQKTKATIRCIPFKLPVDQNQEEGYCISCNQKAKQQVIFAKAY
ncbi:MAG: proline--tRNA ligase [Candidatus Melainabacteria bacterium]|nr:proline--tRNA ligase [Candidatus Melainabacteria bacterium]